MGFLRSGESCFAGEIAYRHKFLDMTHIEVAESNFTRKGKTCPAAMGFSFAAGTTDGQLPPFWCLGNNGKSEQIWDCQQDGKGSLNAMKPRNSEQEAAVSSQALPL